MDGMEKDNSKTLVHFKGGKLKRWLTLKNGLELWIRYTGEKF